MNYSKNFLWRNNTKCELKNWSAIIKLLCNKIRNSRQKSVLLIWFIICWIVIICYTCNIIWKNVLFYYLGWSFKLDKAEEMLKKVRKKHLFFLSFPSMPSPTPLSFFLFYYCSKYNHLLLIMASVKYDFFLFST